MTSSPQPPLAPQPAETASRRHPTRRAVLLGGAAIVLGGGAGAAVGLTHTTHPHAPSPAQAPPQLLAAWRDEQRLTEGLRRAQTAEPGAAAATLGQLADDHVAHAAALAGILAGYAITVPAGAGTSGADTSGAGTSDTAPNSSAPAATATDLRGAERSAALVAGQRASQLTGPVAALLASISACEAGHAAMLS